MKSLYRYLKLFFYICSSSGTLGVYFTHLLFICWPTSHCPCIAPSSVRAGGCDTSTPLQPCHNQRLCLRYCFQGPLSFSSAGQTCITSPTEARTAVYSWPSDCEGADSTSSRSSLPHPLTFASLFHPSQPVIYSLSITQYQSLPTVTLPAPSCCAILAYYAPRNSASASF